VFVAVAGKSVSEQSWESGGKANGSWGKQTRPDGCQRIVVSVLPSLKVSEPTIKVTAHKKFH